VAVGAGVVVGVPRVGPQTLLSSCGTGARWREAACGTTAKGRYGRPLLLWGVMQSSCLLNWRLSLARGTHVTNCAVEFLGCSTQPVLVAVTVV
jgi:hypothetical protein